MNEGQIWFFDSITRNGVVNIIDYLNGKRIPWNNIYFTDKRKKYFADLNIGDEGELRVEFYESSMDKAIDAYYKEDNYYEQKYMIDWLKESMERFDKGVFLLSAEQGTGKSTFAYALDELSANKLKINGTAIRSYYCNRTSIRNPDDFTTSISRIFLTSKDGSEDIRFQYEDSFRGISYKDADRGEAMASLLRNYQKIHNKLFGKEKLLLVIDGVDELTIEALRVLDFIPEPSKLKEGVYILITCRSDNGYGPVLGKFVQNFSFTQIKEFKKEVENRKLLIEALNGIFKTNKIDIGESDLELLADKLDNRFSFIKILDCALNSGIDILKAKDSELFDVYLAMIERYYGKIYYESFLRLFVAIVTAEYPLTMKEAVFTLSGASMQLRDLAFLHDMKPLLTHYHGYFGGLLIWNNNEDIRKYVQEKFYDIILENIRAWEDIVYAHYFIYPLEPDGYGYICAHFLSLNMKYLPSWDSQNSFKKNEHILGSIYSYASKYGYQNNQSFVKERCKLMLESIEKYVKRKNAQCSEIFKEKMLLASMVKKLPLLIKFNNQVEVEKYEQHILEVINNIKTEVEKNLISRYIIFEFYAVIFTYWANKRNISKAEECYVLAKKYLGKENIIYEQQLDVDYISFLKDVDPQRCLIKIDEIFSNKKEWSKIDFAIIKYAQGVANDTLKSNGMSISSDYIQECYDEGLKVINDAIICPQNYMVNKARVLLLIAKAKTHRKWDKNYNKAIKAIDEAIKILRFHINIGNIVDLFDFLSNSHESSVLRQLRNQGNDMQEAFEIISFAVDLYESSKQTIDPLVIANLYTEYVNTLLGVENRNDEKIKACENAINYYRKAGKDDTFEGIVFFKRIIESVRNKDES